MHVVLYALEMRSVRGQSIMALVTLDKSICQMIKYKWLTKLIDSKGTLVAWADLSGTTSREIKQLDQPWNHLILLLCVPKTPVATKTPTEHSFLRVQDQLYAHKHTLLMLRVNNDSIGILMCTA